MPLCRVVCLLRFLDSPTILTMTSAGSEEHVIRLPRIDSEGEYVLVNVIANGSRPLDLRLQATEGENPYTADREPCVRSSMITSDH